MNRLGDHVGQQVAAHDAQVGQPSRPGGDHVVLPLGHQDLAADDPRVGDPAHERDRDEDAARARAEHEDQGDDEHVERERHHDVDQPHDDGVGPAAEVPGQRAEHDTEHEREQHRDERDPQVEPQSVEQPGEGVAAQLVGAEPDGGRSARAATSLRFWAMGLYEVISGAARARPTTTARITIPAISAGCRYHRLAARPSARDNERRRAGRWRGPAGPTGLQSRSPFEPHSRVEGRVGQVRRAG